MHKWEGVRGGKKMDSYNNHVDVNELSYVNPLQLLTPERLDIPIRALTIQKYKDNLLTSFYEKLYAKLVLFRNGAYEPKEYYSLAETKNGVDAHIQSAMVAYNGISSQGFDKKSFIAINEKNQIVDGAHRTASALLLNTNIWVGHVDYQAREQFGFSWFTKHHFSSAEQMVLLNEYARYKGAVVQISTCPPKKHKNDIGFVEIPCSRQLHKLILEQFYENYEELSDVNNSEYVYICFSESKKGLRKQKGCSCWNFDFSNDFYKFFNVNSICYFNTVHLNSNHVTQIKQLSRVLDKTMRMHVLLGKSMMLTLFSGYDCVDERIIAVDSASVKEQIMILKGTEDCWKDVTVVLDPEIKKFKETEDVIRMFGIDMLIPDSRFNIKEEQNNFELQYLCDRLSVQINNSVRTYEERAHYKKKKDSFLLNWRYMHE
jgi:hypothetical protein